MPDFMRQWIALLTKTFLIPKRSLPPENFFKTPLIFCLLSPELVVSTIMIANELNSFCW